MQLSLLLLSSLALPQVDLVLGPDTQSAAVGDTVEITLTAQAATASAEAFSAIDALLSWNPAELSLIDDTDGFPWFVSGFLPDPDGINTVVNDGEALFTVLASPGTPASVPPDILVATFRFMVLAPGEVSLLASSGSFGETRVLGVQPGVVLTGDISATAEVTACPTLMANVFTFNGLGINQDLLTSTPAVAGQMLTATMTPQAARGPGIWNFAIRGGTTSIVIDLGTFLSLPPAGNSELLVGGMTVGNFGSFNHGGGGTQANFQTMVPLNCSLIGFDWYAQSVVTGDLPAGAGMFDPWLSTGVGGTVGSF